MTETKAQFAKRLGVNKSTVTRYHQMGRLVLAPNGKVKIEESLALVTATKGHRSDVSEKHGQTHSTDSYNAAESVTDDDMSATVEVVGADRARYKQAALMFGNNMLKIEMGLASGALANKSDVTGSASKGGRSYRIGIERLIDNLAPVLVNVHGIDNRMAAIAAAVCNEFGV